MKSSNIIDFAQVYFYDHNWKKQLLRKESFWEDKELL